MKEKMWRLILVLFLLVAVVAFGIFSEKVLIGKVVEETNVDKVYEKDYIRENCECVERNIFVCGFEGFEYGGEFCEKGKEITNPIRKCSKFDCSGYIVEVNSSFYD